MAFCTEIVCDGCSFYITKSRILSKEQMIHIAREAGWSIGKYHLCPECRKKRHQLIKDGWLK